MCRILQAHLYGVEVEAGVIAVWKVENVFMVEAAEGEVIREPGPGFLCQVEPVKPGEETAEVVCFHVREVVAGLIEVCKISARAEVFQHQHEVLSGETEQPGHVFLQKRILLHHLVKPGLYNSPLSGGGDGRVFFNPGPGLFDDESMVFGHSPDDTIHIAFARFFEPENFLTGGKPAFMLQVMFEWQRFGRLKLERTVFHRIGMLL